MWAEKKHLMTFHGEKKILETEKWYARKINKKFSSHSSFSIWFAFESGVREESARSTVCGFYFVFGECLIDGKILKFFNFIL